MGTGRTTALGWRRAAPVLGALGASLGILGVATWYGCAIYGPSLLLPAAGDDGGGDAEPAEAGDAGDGEAASPCPEVFPPSPPAADDPSGSSDQTFVAALHTLDLGIRTDGGAPPLYGYDLDHVFTCCMGAPESCKPPVTGSQHCDEDGGRDNSGGQLIGDFALLDPAQFNSTTISQRLETGAYSLLLQVLHYDGKPNDTQVTAALYASEGIEAQGDAAPPMAKWDGTDVWAVDDLFVLNGPDASPVLPNHFDAHAYVTNGVLVMHVNFPISLGTTSTGVVTLDLTGGVLTGRVVPVGDGTYRVEGGQVAGRWAASSVLGALDSLTFGGQPVCRGTQTYASVKQQICAAADITADPGSDNRGAPCDALSIGFGFTADPALMGDVVSQPARTSPCGDGGPEPPDDCTMP